MKVRLTLAFSALMAVLLAAGSYFLYSRLATSLDRQIDAALHSRAIDVTTLARSDDDALQAVPSARGPKPGANFAQVLRPDGAIAEATRTVAAKPLLTALQISRALTESEWLTMTVNGEPVRLLAQPVGGKSPRVVVVGASLMPRDTTLSHLRGNLFIGGPIGLLLSCLIGYGVTVAAFRPVEKMRTEAARISAEQLGWRLRQSGSGDELDRLCGTLNAMLGRLEQSLASERRFVSDASHELRTPLSLIKTEVELALQPGRSRAQLQSALRSVGEETDRLAQLADDLLVLASADDGSVPLQPALTDVGSVLDGVALRFAARARFVGRSIGTDAGDVPDLVMDRHRVEQALGNLVENALQHGGGAIRLFAVGREDSLELHVADEGNGFPPAFRPMAFERFTRSERQRTGAGLGLAIVEMIACAHGGSAAIAETGHGADVSITLPVHARTVSAPAPV